MTINIQETQAIVDRWRPEYVERAAHVESELTQLFQEAVTTEEPHDLLEHGGVSKSLPYIAMRSEEFEHRIVLFLYSEQFDDKFAGTILSPDEPYRAGDPTPRAVFERKVARLGKIFEPFVLLTDSLTRHYVAALMQGRHGSELPLIWDVPTPAEEETGVSDFAMWWTSFQYLCEISKAIFAYGGFSQEFSNELAYVCGKTHLRRRLLWLTQDLDMYFPDNDTVTWPATDMATVLAEIEDRSAE